MQVTHSSLENPFSFVIQEKESNDQYSVVGLIKDAFTTEESQDIFNHLQTLEFRKGETSFGAIPRDQIWFNKCGEEFGKRAGWKNSDNLRWKSCPMDSYLDNICQQVQTKFNSYKLDNIPGVKGIGAKTAAYIPIQEMSINRVDAPNEVLQSEETREFFILTDENEDGQLTL
mgnify:CR=1 FL=1